MKIDKNYKGLERLGNGDYFLKGSLITDENLEIELNDRFKVEKSIIAKSIEINTTLIAGWGIVSGWGIVAGDGIEAGDGIKAGWGIKAGCGIVAGDGIEAGSFINCGKRIFAGISAFDNEENCKKTIKCAELRNGQIAYGDLILIKQEEKIEEMTMEEICKKLGKNIKIVKGETK